MDVNSAMIRPAPYRLTNPILRYQLDPCEPGLLRSARASDSIAAVSAQERGNLAQFKREAFMAGRMVIYESITFTRGIDGLFSSIRAGLTEVVSVPMPSRADVPLPAETGIETDIEIETPQTSADALEDEIHTEEIELLSKLAALKNRIEVAKASVVNEGYEIPSISEDTEYLEPLQLGIEPDENDEEVDEAENGDEETLRVGLDAPELEDITLASPLISSDDDPVIEEIDIGLPGSDEVTRQEEEIRELNQKLNDLETLRLQAGIAQLNEVVMGAIQQNIDLITNLVAVANHVGPNNQINNLTTTVPLLGNILDYSV